MGGLEGRLAEDDAVVGDDAEHVAVDAGETGDDRLAPFGLERGELRTVDDSGDDLGGVERDAVVG